MMPHFAPPDRYHLAARDVAITYYPGFADELPSLTYQDRHHTLRFRGDEIRRVEVPYLGVLVSVTLVLSVDSGFTTFTLVLPHVNLPQQSGASCRIECPSILTIHRLSPSPMFDEGQQASYSSWRLTGTASLVIVPR
jgi:hypothetical protein